MSYPKHTKTWRQITVDNQRFRWRFKAGPVSGTLTLHGMVSSGQQVIVTLDDWRDPWLIDGNSPVMQNEPSVITPRFAAQAICFGLASGWNSHEAGPLLYVSYSNELFAVSRVDLN